MRGMGNPRATHSIRMESPSSTAKFGGGLIIFGETTRVKETDTNYMQSLFCWVFGETEQTPRHQETTALQVHVYYSQTKQDHYIKAV